jgi:ABC-type multidrug transport system ATPase subunit/pSer/pThr/pTyr-binding forkhead associated (FHA) protein
MGSQPGGGSPAPALAAGLGRGRGATEATAQLVVQVTGEAEARVYPVRGEAVRFGRGDENDIAIDVPYLSRQQGTLRQAAGAWSLEPAPEATAAISRRGETVTALAVLEAVDYFRVAGESPGEMVTFIFVASPEAAAAAPAEGTIPLEPGRTVRIGSAADADIGAESALLAPYHAEVVHEGARIVLKDLGAGTTLVHGEVVIGEVELAPGAAISAGGLRMTLTDGAIQYRDPSAAVITRTRRARILPDELLGKVAGTGGVELVGLHLQREVRGANLLSDVSLRIRPREFVVIVGLSGAGKTTLMNALAGFRPATSGDVLVDGVSLYQNLDRFRSAIGYVPQRDIVHANLTVFEALDYAARLRLPPGTREAERHERVEEVLRDLGLAHRRDQLVARLSGGQVKRVSIGVELISQPQLLFLDEPTSGLDPVTETGLMQLLRGLADQGRTVIVITHATKNVMLADKVLFIVPGGRVAWFGTPAEALAYFDASRPEAERRDRQIEFDHIYRILEDAAAGAPEEWEQRYRSHAAYQRYIARPLGLDAATPTLAPSRDGVVTPRRTPSAIRQFLALSSRNVRLLTRDRFALVLMLAAAPALALLDFFITKRDMFDPLLGDTARIVTNTNTIIVNAMLVGALAQAREIIKDRDIYKRERLVNLKIGPYILSKVWVAAVLALYQAAAWVVIRNLAVDMPGGASEFGSFYLTMVLVTFCGMMLGLFASAAAPTEDSVTLIIALLIVPQVLFSGAHLPVHQLDTPVRMQTDIMPSRWAFEALITIGGQGADLANDPCWANTTPEERRAMTPEQKASCACLGPDLFDRCEFPGIRSYLAPGEPGPDGSISDRSVALAEGRLEVDYDSYGPIYDVNLLSRWGALLAISVALIGIILGIQRLRERVS